MFLISGEKEFTIFPFSDTPYLYPTRKNELSAWSSAVNISNVDLSVFSEFSKAKPYKVRIEAGINFSFFSLHSPF